MSPLQSILANAPLPGSWTVLLLLLPACLVAFALRGRRARLQQNARHRLRRDFWGYD